MYLPLCVYVCVRGSRIDRQIKKMIGKEELTTFTAFLITEVHLCVSRAINTLQNTSGPENPTC